MNIQYPRGPQGLPPNFAQPSPDFKKGIKRVILTLFAYFSIYLLLLTAGIAIAVALTLLGIGIISIKIHGLTLLMAGALVFAGLMVLYFLVKFIFTAGAKTPENYVEITEQQHPRLFEFVRKISDECGTHFPAHIYLCSDVNAAVFYDSTFKSMFMPVRKNLVIGLGVVNALNLSEFKAVLAHEFGHFSQKSMKAGSYVYQANRTIYNMLYDNDSFSAFVNRVAGIHFIFYICTGIAVGVIKSVQYVQRHAYTMVNLQYNYLSQQMEFHADTISAMIAGSNNAISALKRIMIAESCYDAVIGNYNNWLRRNVQARNLYKDQLNAAQHYAAANKLALKNGLPLPGEQATTDDYIRVNLENSWSSHPTMEQREAALLKLQAEGEVIETSPWELFDAPEQLQLEFTAALYKNAPFNGKPELATDDLFAKEMDIDRQTYELPDIYDRYYDRRHIYYFDIENVTEPAEQINDIASFYSQNTHLVLRLFALEKDLETLDEISKNTTAVKYFNFNGEKRKGTEATDLRKNMVAEYDGLFDTIAGKDRAAYLYFFALASKTGEELVLMNQYEACYRIAEMYNAQRDAYLDIFKVAGELYSLETDDIYRDNPQNLAEQCAAFLKIYAETSSILTTLHNTSQFNIPEDAANLATQLPDMDTTALTGPAINRLHDMAVLLYNWVHTAISQVKKDLLVHQLTYLPKN